MAITRIGGANAISGTISAANFPTGSVIQVQSTVNTALSTQSLANSSLSEVSNMSVNITPTSSSSKFLITSNCMFETSANIEHSTVFYFYRNSTTLRAADVGNRNGGIMPPALSFYSTDTNSTASSVSLQYLDEPNTTSQISYKLGVTGEYGGTIDFHVNRCHTDDDLNSRERGISTITVMEIKG